MSPARLVVVGDLLLDREIVGSTTRLCPDAPAPVIDVERVDEGPGGAGLAAVLGSSADVAVTLIAPVADDPRGERARAGLHAAGVDVVALGHEGATRTKCRIRIGDQVVARLDGKHLNRDVPSLAGTIPTCEALALDVFRRLLPRLPGNVTLERVRIMEDPTLYADCTGLD